MSAKPYTCRTLQQRENLFDTDYTTNNSLQFTSCDFCTLMAPFLVKLPRLIRNHVRYWWLCTNKDTHAFKTEVNMIALQSMAKKLYECMPLMLIVCISCFFIGITFKQNRGTIFLIAGLKNKLFFIYVVVLHVIVLQAKTFKIESDIHGLMMIKYVY